ncbi:MAG: recombinase family protein, partial [Acidobacteriota bacterium]
MIKEIAETAAGERGSTGCVAAAIYARKSTEQVGVADDGKSVARQVENARSFAEANGYTVADEHIYVDDAVSGAADLAKLRSKTRLLADIAAGPKFQVLV